MTGISAVAVVLALTRRRAVVLPVVGLSLVVVGAWGAYWRLWGMAFDAADANRPVPVAVDRGQDAAMYVGAVSVVVLLAHLTAQGLRSRRLARAAARV